MSKRLIFLLDQILKVMRSGDPGSEAIHTWQLVEQVGEECRRLGIRPLVYHKTAVVPTPTPIPGLGEMRTLELHADAQDGGDGGTMVYTVLPEPTPGRVTTVPATQWTGSIKGVLRWIERWHDELQFELNQETAGDAGKGDPVAESDRARDVAAKADVATNDDALLTPRQIAVRLGRPEKAEAFRQKLTRQMNAHKLPHGAVIENADPSKGQARFLYRFDMVRHLFTP